MRDILKKATTGAMIAGAALLVAACGGDTAANDVNAVDLGNDVSLDANATDMGLDMNATTDMNAVDMNAVDMNTTTTTTTTETNTTTNVQ